MRLTPTGRPAARPVAVVGSALALAAALAACSSGTTAATEETAAAAAADGVDLSGICPATVVIQTDWNPESEHGHLYQMLGPDPVVDADKKSVTGDLYADGSPTGVKLEVRSGGPAIGYQTVSSQMYQDDSITLGYVSTDEAVQLSATLPTTAVFAQFDVSPQMIMWDPETYPDVTTIAELNDALPANGGVVRYFGGAAYMSYLIGSGTLDEANTDGSYDGTPAKFVADQGISAQQGFATAEPYIYENEVSAWAKPVAFQLIHDTGYPVYAGSVSVKTGDLEELSDCLTALVPIMQQATVDYTADPAATNELILELVQEFNNGWTYSQGVADFSVEQQIDLGILSNGDDDTLGDMDPERIQTVIDIDTPIFTESGSAPKDGLTVDDLYTNEFLDPSIGL